MSDGAAEGHDKRAQGGSDEGTVAALSLSSLAASALRRAAAMADAAPALGSAAASLQPRRRPHPLTFPTSSEGVLTSWAGQPLVPLALRFGTPLFVYDAAVVAARVRSLRAFDVVRYAQKANSSLAVLDVVRRAGALVDATSAGELHRALAAGFAARDVSYTADVFDRETLELVVLGGFPVNCGSSDMIWQYAERVRAQAQAHEQQVQAPPLAVAAGTCSVTLRVNPGFGHGHSRKVNTGGVASKHGIWHEELPAVVARAVALGVRVAGLHVHIGSGSDLAHLSQVAGAVERLARVVGPQLEALSAGGGLPVPYAEGEGSVDNDMIARYLDLWDGVRRRLEAAFGHALRLEIEPGRFLVADAGVLLAEVRALKRTGDAGFRFCLLDAGFNTLVRPAMYGAFHPMAIAPADGSDAASWPLDDFMVAGPLCESGDVFTVGVGGEPAPVRLPEPRVGDVLVIGLAGAYGFSMSSTYNSRPLAAEVMVLDGEAVLVRDRQTSADLMRGERVAGVGEGVRRREEDGARAQC